MPGPLPDPDSPAPQKVALPSTVDERKSVVTNWAIAVVVIAFVTWRFPELARTLLSGILTLSVLVFVHELGHFQFARWGGMKVNRFGVGFPPWIYTRNYKGIDYSIGALPIGGMVDIAGLGSEEEMVATAKGESNTNAPSQQAANPNAPHGAKSFQDAKLSARFWTLFAGPLMNFVFALVIFVGLFSIWGTPDQDKSKQINEIKTVRFGEPADLAGLHEGDKVIGINSLRTDDTFWLSQTIRDSDKQFDFTPLVEKNADYDASGTTRAELGTKPISPLTLTLMREGQEITKQVTPRVGDLPIGDGSTSLSAPMIGIEFDDLIVRKKVSLGEAAKQGVLLSAAFTYQMVRVLGRAATFKLTKEEKRGVQGPVGIFREINKAAQNGFYDLFMLAGIISVNLGLMNLLPFPALDGGRILFLGYELIFRKPIDARKEGFVHMVGMAMLLTFMLFITVRDIVPWVVRSLRGVF